MLVQVVGWLVVLGYEMELARRVAWGFEGPPPRRGIENRITWVNIMEILDTPETIQPGELLITTGYGLSDKAKYGDLIARLKSRGISGIAVQTGYYIDQIPNFILEAANQHDLPILHLPAEYSFSDILRILIGEIGAEPELLTPSGFDSGYFQQTLSEQLTEHVDFPDGPAGPDFPGGPAGPRPSGPHIDGPNNPCSGGDAK